MSEQSLRAFLRHQAATVPGLLRRNLATAVAKPAISRANAPAREVMSRLDKALEAPNAIGAVRSDI